MVKLLALLMTATSCTFAAETIVQLAQRTPSLSTLVALLGSAGLVTTVNTTSPLTVFAPTNDAFSALGPNILDYVTNPKNLGSLTNTLTYHVSHGPR